MTWKFSNIRQRSWVYECRLVICVTCPHMNIWHRYGYNQLFSPYRKIIQWHILLSLSTLMFTLSSIISLFTTKMVCSYFESSNRTRVKLSIFLTISIFSPFQITQSGHIKFDFPDYFALKVNYTEYGQKLKTTRNKSLLIEKIS